jgi:hypothetical protein
MKRARILVVTLGLAVVMIAGGHAVAQEETPDVPEETPAQEEPADDGDETPDEGATPDAADEPPPPEDEKAGESTDAPEPAKPAKKKAKAKPAADAKWTRLIGNARRGRRDWVPGVTVLVLPEWGLPKVFVTSTDEKGTFRLDQLEEGRYAIRFLKYGFVSIQKDNVELEFPFQAVVEVVMEDAEGPSPPVLMTARGTIDSTEKATVRGSTVDRKGEPLAEVRVRMLKADGTVDPVFALTDENGEFEFPEIAPGMWDVEIYGAGYLPVRAPASWYGEMELRAVLVTQPATYEPQPLDLMPPEEPIPPRDPMDPDAQAHAGMGP